MEIRLDLTRHCIATEIKKIYNKKIAGYFKSKGERRELEEAIELLKNAMEKIDLPRLRGACLPLAGHCDDQVAIKTGEGDIPVITVNGTPVKNVIR